MAKEWGSARRGNDSDEGNSGLVTRKVQIENSYFEKLADRVHGGAPPQEFHHPVVGTAEPDDGDTWAALDRIEAAEAARAAPAPAPAAPAAKPSPGIIYGDDGYPLKP
jgi:hypothetical protein